MEETAECMCCKEGGYDYVFPIEDIYQGTIDGVETSLCGSCASMLDSVFVPTLPFWDCEV